MKICDLTQFYSPFSGGVKRYLHEKIAFIREHTSGTEHVLIVPGERDEVEVADRSTTYTLRSPLISRTSRYRALIRLSAIEKVLERERPDLIESGDPYQVAWKALASGRALGIPVIGFYHSHFPEAYLRSASKYLGHTATQIVMDMAQRYVRELYSQFAATLVPSPALAQVLQNWGVQNVVSVDLGVNTSVYHPAPETTSQARNELGIPRSKVLLLYVGRLAHEKNTTTLFDSFQILHKAHPSRFHLLVIGDGAQRRLLQHLRRETGAVTWRSYCDDPHQLADFYRAADLFVHPGVQETFGFVALESQACGTPVIGIRGSYMDRIIMSDQEHWARANTPGALAEAILRALAGNHGASAATASKAVSDLYSWTEVFRRLFDIYRGIIQRHREQPDA